MVPQADRFCAHRQHTYIGCPRRAGARFFPSLHRILRYHEVPGLPNRLSREKRQSSKIGRALDVLRPYAGPPEEIPVVRNVDLDLREEILEASPLHLIDSFRRQPLVSLELLERREDPISSQPSVDGIYDPPHEGGIERWHHGTPRRRDPVSLRGTIPL